MRYTTKPVTVEAMQWAGGNIEEVMEFLKSNLPYPPTVDYTRGGDDYFYILWLGVFYFIEKGDWVLCGEGYSLKVCDDLTFKETYIKEE